MDWDQVYEANAALDLYLEAQKAESDKAAAQAQAIQRLAKLKR